MARSRCVELPGQRGPRPAADRRRDQAPGRSAMPLGAERGVPGEGRARGRLLAMAGPGSRRCSSPRCAEATRTRSRSRGSSPVAQADQPVPQLSWRSMGALALTGDWRRAPLEPLIPASSTSTTVSASAARWQSRRAVRFAATPARSRRNHEPRGRADDRGRVPRRFQARTVPGSRRPTTGRRSARRATPMARCSSPTRC